MQAELKVALVQTTLAWEDIAANLQHFTALLADVPPVDVIVLPEMFSTGFSMNTALAESMDGSAVTWMKDMAAKKKSVLCGSLMIVENGSFFNRFVWVTPAGSIAVYDKRHLFSLSKEQLYYTAGTQKLVIEYKGWKICPMICYDLRFPAWSRNQSLYDVLLYVASWPQKRSLAWKALLPARAIENQCYVIGVNRVGRDGSNVEHAGDSALFSPLGDMLSANIEDKECVAMVELQASTIKDVRAKLPFLQDADTFMISSTIESKLD